MVRILRWLANKLENFNNKVATAWNKWLGKIKMQIDEQYKYTYNL